MVNLKWWEDPEQVSLLRKRFEAVNMDRRNFVKLVSAAAGGTLTASVLAACGGDEGEAPDAGQPGTTPAAAGEKEETPAGPIDREGEEAAEQLFRTNFERDPLSHDFNKDLYCGGESSLFAQLGMFNTDLEVEPDIAESWEPNEDASVWTFSLRKDTAWSNGDPVTAHDYEWSWKRQLDPATAAPYAGFLYDIKNAESFNDEQGATIDEVGVRALDDHTLEVELEGPRAYFPTVATYIAAAPAHRPSVEAHGDQWTEVGNIVSNGPFKLVSWDHDVRVVIEKNEHYWKFDQIKLQTVERPIIRTDASQLAYENNEIDWHYRGQLGQFDRVQNDPQLSQEMVKYNLVGTWYLVPDPNFEPFNVKEVRQAMGHCIDRDVIVNQVLRGLATPAYTFQPPGAPGYDPNTYDEFTRFDPEYAMSLLDGTPYAGGQNWPPMTLTHREEGDAPKAAAEAIIRMLNQHLGMEIQHEVGEPRETYERMWNHEIPLMWVRWFSDYPDPNNTLYQVWYSKFPTGSRHAWSNDEFDQLVSDARGEADEQKRWEMYWEANRIQLEDGAAIYVYNPWNYGLMKPWVSNLPRNRDGDFVPAWNIFIRDYDHYVILEH